MGARQERTFVITAHGNVHLKAETSLKNKFYKPFTKLDVKISETVQPLAVS